jgi:hypothetical protein
MVGPPRPSRDQAPVLSGRQGEPGLSGSGRTTADTILPAASASCRQRLSGNLLLTIMANHWLRNIMFLGVVIALGGADSCDRPPPNAEAGRYWARIGGYGSAVENGTAWFEYRPSTITSWGFVPRTPVRPVVAGEDLSLADEWLYGLEPGTVYEYRMCHADFAGTTTCDETSPAYSFTTRAPSGLPWIELDPTNSRHLRLETGERFTAWGNNYVAPNHTGLPNQLFEDQMYSETGQAFILADLARLRNLGPPTGRSNVIRIHLQFEGFLLDPVTPNREALARLARLVELAEDQELRVMITGLNYFFPADNPAWVALQTEAERWASQALWWNQVASAIAKSPGVFAFDLMNEPYAQGGGVLADGRSRFTTVAPDAYCDYGEDASQGRHGTCFGQYVTATPGTRTASEIMAEWTRRMVQAITFDRPVGAGAFGMSNPINSSPAVHQHLDFLSPHLYPDRNNGQDAIDLAAAIAAISTQPIIAGETFPFGPVDRLISQTCNAGTVQGWFGQYDGRTLGEPCGAGVCWLFDVWYALQRDWSTVMLAGGCPAPIP